MYSHQEDSILVSLMSFKAKLEARCQTIHSLLCVGLDPHESELFPKERSSTPTDEERCDAAYTFCHTLISTTLPYTACYKPNAAFFEALGEGGMAVLKRVVGLIPDDVPILLDVKRGDIGSTATAYAQACFDYIGADAVTLSPLMGFDSISPFVTGKYAEKGAFLLCKTSNPGSSELLSLPLAGTQQTLFERIAHLVGNDWSCQTGAALGLVVGATDPDALRRARVAAGDAVWILAPGVGAQGGDLLDAVRAGLNRQGAGLLIPVSRGISQAQDPAAAAKQLQENINAVREEVQKEASSSVVADELRPYQKEFLEFSLSLGVLKFGSFVLKSGRTSPYFFNAGLFASGAAIAKLAKAYAATIMASSELARGEGKVIFDVVFGPAYKGIPLGAALSSTLYNDYGIDVGFSYNRKEAKDHGEGGSLVGASMEGKRVLIVDDVITAGTAIRESYDLLKSVAAEPVGVIIALDRAEVRSEEDRVSAVQAVVRDFSIPVASIVSLPQLQAFLEQSSGTFSDETRHSVAAYRKEYGL